MGQRPASLHPDTGVCQQKKLDLADDFRDARDMQTQPVPCTWNSVIWGADHLHQYHVLSMLDVLMCRWLRRSGKELQHGLSIRHPYYHVHKMLNFPLAKGNSVAALASAKTQLYGRSFSGSARIQDSPCCLSRGEHGQRVLPLTGPIFIAVNGDCSHYCGRGCSSAASGKLNE